MDEIFPPYKGTQRPGEDPFEAVMCAVGAASQISCLKDSIFHTKYHLQSMQDFTRKGFNQKRYTECEIYRCHFGS